MSSVSGGLDWWQASDGNWYPPELAHPGPAPDPVLITIGDIACTEHQVLTPSGSRPLAGTTWIVTNQTQVVERIPPVAIVLAIIFALACLLGLLFLLMKERTVQGFVQVSVQGPSFYHATQVPISSQAEVFEIENRVNYIRGLVARLPA